MAVFEIDPLSDPRWTALVESHPRSSVFHTREWLEALRRTYHYKVTAFTTNPAGVSLTNGLVFCQINSWLTGPRLISLPFSDHCDPLARDEDLKLLLAETAKKAATRLRYVEIRPRCVDLSSDYGFCPHQQYYLHSIDLSAGLIELRARLHKDSIQRKIRRAEREHILTDQGRSPAILQHFYELLVLTRRRHRIPPQPLSWFRNLIDCFGDRLQIRVAMLGGRPIASLLTLRHKTTLVYKYGCSDVRFHMLGGMPLLFWQAIEEAKSEKMQQLDLGRSDTGNAGLVRFKDHLGATKSSLTYCRVSRTPQQRSSGVNDYRFVKNVVCRLPDNLFRLAGEIFYRHAG